MKSVAPISSTRVQHAAEEHQLAKIHEMSEPGDDRISERVDAAAIVEEVDAKRVAVADDPSPSGVARRRPSARTRRRRAAIRWCRTRKAARGSTRRPRTRRRCRTRLRSRRRCRASATRGTGSGVTRQRAARGSRASRARRRRRRGGRLTQIAAARAQHVAQRRAEGRDLLVAAPSRCTIRRGIRSVAYSGRSSAKRLTSRPFGP